MKKLILIIWIIVSFFNLKNVNAATTARALILDQGANVRTGPSTKYQRITSLGKYSYYNLVTTQTFKDENDGNGCSKDWYQLYYNGIATGYVCGEHVEVVESYATDDVEPTTECEIEMNNLGFPSSYWGGLCRIKQDHPNWNFVVLATGSDFAETVEGESSCGKNLIYGSDSNKGFIDSSCNKYDSGYVGMTANGVAYYMDPRNFLSERYVFQFLHLGYDEKFAISYPNGVTSILGNSLFYKYHMDLNNNIPELINVAGNELNVSPIFISARILQELGNKDTLYNLYSGIYDGLENAYYGYYNFYNFGVSDSCVQSYGTTYCGLNYAKNKNWNTVDAAIKGGVSQLSNYYLKRNQYTLYLQKFNVLGSENYSKYSHQYMTNVSAPMSESTTTYNTYVNLDIINSDFIFYIPVFGNMNATIDNNSNGAILDNDNTTNTTTIDIPTIVTSSGYKYSGGNISGISVGTTGTIIKKTIESISGNNTVTVTDAAGNILVDGIVGTGSKIVINNSNTTETLNIIIKGDTSGDGKINALDLLQVQKSILKTHILNEIASLAGDTSGDGNINALDLLQIQKSILGTQSIEQ